MSLTPWLARRALQVKRWIERVFPGPTVAKFIEPYMGYATSEHLILRGRVLGSVRSEKASHSTSRRVNALSMLRTFLTDEVADAEVVAGGVTARTDEEGYFTLLLPRDTALTGRGVTVSSGDATAECRVAIPGPDARFMVVSDIDDTVMKTGAYSMIKNLWTSFTGHPTTRHVFPDAVELMDFLHDDGRNPVYYVSSSPWNFYPFLRTVFQLHDLPDAPMFLRDYGISETQLIAGSHGDHKGSAIDTLAAAHPDLPMILIGDTGQHDAQVYADAAERMPGRVAHVILHEPRSGALLSDQVDVDRLVALGVPVYVRDSYGQAIDAMRKIYFQAGRTSP